MRALRLYDSRGAIPKITGKTMAILGENNAIKLMKDYRHFPMRDDPPELAKLIIEFMGV